MGTQFTPLLQLPIPDWAEKPDVPKWMMTTQSEAERHMVLNFATETARDTAIPTQNRFKGQMCYTADVDTFKYWNGNNWVRANVGKDFAAASYATYGTDVTLKPAGYYDYKLNLTVTRPCGVLIMSRAMFTCTSGDLSSGGNSGTQSAYLAAWLDDSSKVGGAVARWYQGYLRTAGLAVSADLSMITRLSLTPGPHTFGMRVTAGTAGVNLVIGYAQIWAVQVSSTAMAGGPSGQYGDW